MSDFPSRSGFSLRDAGERLVRAVVQDAEDGVFRPLTFPVAAVDGVIGLGEKRSALILRSGLRVNVALPYGELEEKIYTPDFRQPIIDLCAVTGQPAAPGALKIKALLRKSASDETVTLVFAENEIVRLEAEESGMFTKSGKGVEVYFNEAARKNPFGKKAAVLDMPYADYKRYLGEARQRGLDMVDFCDIFAKNPDRFGYQRK